MPRATSVERASQRVSELSAEAAEKGQYRALHAQGNPRAAARGGQHAAGARGQWPPAGGRVRPQGRRRYSRASSTCASWPAAPATTRAWWRSTSSSRSAAFPAASRSPASTAIATPWCPKNSLFVTISQSGETADTLAALRLAKQSGYLADAGGLQFARELAGARVGPGDADARRPGDRRGFHQGLHHADRRAVAAGDCAGQDAWLGCRARARHW